MAWPLGVGFYKYIQAFTLIMVCSDFQRPNFFFRFTMAQPKQFEIKSHPSSIQLQWHIEVHLVNILLDALRNQSLVAKSLRSSQEK